MSDLNISAQKMYRKRDILLGLVIAAIIVFWFSDEKKLSPPPKKEEAYTGKLLHTESLLTKEYVKSAQLDESLSKKEEEVNILLNKLDQALSRIEVLETEMDNKNFNIKALETQLKMRLEDLQHMVKATKLHSTIDQSVILKSEYQPNSGGNNDAK
ncbi:hypothetical protein [Vibrio coralliilyticus]|uniref:hypothetical protein n=1 Tax=Vibrio coralliilyticus TaxID=190893 RepID=UPI00036B9E77|nr:hypothetical protein [Vibrio coralliilyticus]